MDRMRLTVEPDGDVTISYVDEWACARVTRTFFVPSAKGERYVKERKAGFPQVCEELSALGSTLRASMESLPAVIRREYRKMRRTERREWGRFS